MGSGEFNAEGNLAIAQSLNITETGITSSYPGHFARRRLYLLLLMQRFSYVFYAGFQIGGQKVQYLI